MGLDLFVVVNIGSLSELGPGKGSSCVEWRTFVFNEEIGLDTFDRLDNDKDLQDERDPGEGSS